MVLHLDLHSRDMIKFPTNRQEILDKATTTDPFRVACS